MEACKSRYGAETELGKDGGKEMLVQVVIPHLDFINSVGNGTLYSFLPTQLKFNVPIVCHVPFKLDASREFVDPQGNNRWFTESCEFLSNLLDYAYSDWCKTVKADIVRYIPGKFDSIFQKNNDKVRCLSEQSVYKGNHFLSLPLFYTSENHFKTGSEIMCFEPNENIQDPETAYLLLDHRNELFIPPIDVKISKFGFNVEQNIYLKLIKRALSKPDITVETLKYLDDVKYKYDEETISKLGKITLTVEQIEEISHHTNLMKRLQTVTSKAVKQGLHLDFLVNGNFCKLAKILYDEFEISETPKSVELYLNHCKQNCILADIKGTLYLPCDNGIVLSKEKTLASFATFCYAVDERDTFAIRMRFREASARLNQYDGTDISAKDYLRELKNIRMFVKDSLGRDGYNNYINLILKSGTDKNRFVQELIQNADDCKYPENVIPTFNIYQQGETVIAEYNECGFTRENVRSITAMGESTKNKLLEGGDLTPIGEKGVGFKTIFGVASEVKIHSGEFNFSLTDLKPTIPKEIGEPDEEVEGTRMIISLKSGVKFPIFGEKEILELCMCLRKLRQLKINGHMIMISDSSSERVITVDKRRYAFKRFAHAFKVTDEHAIKERENGIHKVSAEQRIICYVPEKNDIMNFHVYSGLPTKHIINIPLIIDAPFELTTSREEIDLGCEKWNDFIRKEMYNAIVNVIEGLKGTDGIDVLRFIRYLPRMVGKTLSYLNEMFDDEYLKSYDFVSIVKSYKILPTFKPNCFVSPQSKQAHCYPDVVNYLFFSEHAFGNLNLSCIINTAMKDYSAALNALGCEAVSFDNTFEILKNYAESFIHDKVFRSKLYNYLEITIIPEEKRNLVKRLKIFPVYSRIVNQTEYIRWNKNSIYVKKYCNVSSENYYILNESVLTKFSCEKIVGDNINEIDDRFEQSFYNENLEKVLRGTDENRIYEYIIREFQNGSFEKYNSFTILRGLRELIPLKNRLGEITDRELFICKHEDGYFPVDSIRQITIHGECMSFAEYLQYSDLSTVHFSDFDYHETLCDDDVESLMDEYFKNSDEILRGFYQEGLLSENLISMYRLEYISMGRSTDDEEDGDFPEDPVYNLVALKTHVQKLCQNPTEIFSEKEERTVYKCRTSTGNVFSLNSENARKEAMNTYTPEDTYGKCHCQMCHRVKSYKFIEVNSIERSPKYYFPQLRIALCLECSKRFETFRNDTETRENFLNAIINASYRNCGNVDIPICNEKITFTAKHLAEIQEILKYAR